MNMADELFNTPKDLEKFAGQFVVFFSEDEQPEVIFNTPISEAAYAKADEIAQAQNRKPVVMRIQENPQNNIAQIITTRAHA